MPAHHVGETIRSSRLARGWTQEVLARRAGITGMTISKIERGVANYRWSTVERIAAALGLDTGQLLLAARVKTETGAADPLTTRLLDLWSGIPLEHRHAALAAVNQVHQLAAELRTARDRVAAADAEVQRLGPELRRLESQIERLETERAEQRRTTRLPPAVSASRRRRA